MVTPDARNLIWMDLEMTGLVPGHDVITEIATLVTDPDLEIIAGGLAFERRFEAWDKLPCAVHVGQRLAALRGIRRRHGRGPMRAVDVHQALVEGALPGGSGPGGPAGRALGLLEKQLGRQGQGLPPGLARKDG